MNQVSEMFPVSSHRTLKLHLAHRCNVNEIEFFVFDFSFNISAPTQKYRASLFTYR